MFVAVGDDYLSELLARDQREELLHAGCIELVEEVVGGHVAQLTESVRLENHVMYVRITSSVVRHEIFLRRDALAEQINAALGMKLVNVLIVK